MPFATQGGRRVHYTVQGAAGPVVLFANSIGTGLGMWDAQAAALSASFRLIRFDARGHGGSDPAAEPAGIADLANDALAVMDAAGADRAHLVGLSLGGMVAQAVALRAPGRVLSLVLCATGAALLPPDFWEARARTVLAEGMEPMVAASEPRWFTPDFRAREPAAVSQALDMLRATDPGSYAACCRVIRDTDLRPDLPRLALPVLLIAGEHDVATPPAKLEEIAALVPGSRLLLRPAAHLLNIELAGTVTADIASFIGTLPS